jgi:hypothetical protein
MALSNAGERTLITDRSIQCAGYRRADSRFDVEGTIIDTRGYGQEITDRGWIDAGTPVHQMHVRLTFDADFVIEAVESQTVASPQDYCRGMTPNMQRLVGLRITGGFKKAMHERIGGTAGCTHIVTLVEALATVAIQTVAGHRKMSGGGFLDTFGTRGKGRPALLDSCYAYAADSPVARRLWPDLAKRGPNDE